MGTGTWRRTRCHARAYGVYWEETISIVQLWLTWLLSFPSLSRAFALSVLACHSVCWSLLCAGIGASWLRSFRNFDARERAGTFNDSDEYLIAMLTAPPRTITVSAGYGRSPIRREYTMDIVPSKIAQRVLAARRLSFVRWYVAHALFGGHTPRQWGQM